MNLSPKNFEKFFEVKFIVKNIRKILQSNSMLKKFEFFYGQIPHKDLYKA